MSKPEKSLLSKSKKKGKLLKSSKKKKKKNLNVVEFEGNHFVSSFDQTRYRSDSVGAVLQKSNRNTIDVFQNKSARVKKRKMSSLGDQRTISKRKTETTSGSGYSMSSDFELLWNQIGDDVIVNGSWVELIDIGLKENERLMKDVIIAYRLYSDISVMEVWSLMKLRYFQYHFLEFDVELRETVVSMVVYWITVACEDFLSVENNVIELFIDELKQYEKRFPVRRKSDSMVIQEAWMSALEKHENAALFPHNMKEALESENILDNDLLPDELVFDYSNCSLFGELLSVIDLHLFDKNSVGTFFDPGDKDFSESINVTSRWAATQILISPEESRVRVLVDFINLANHLLKIRNFNSLFAIYSGLTLYAVQRLKSVWDALTEPVMEKYKKIEELCKPHGNFRNLTKRQEESAKKGSIIPCSIIFKKNLSVINETMDSYTSEGKINGEKIRSYRTLFESVFEVSNQNHSQMQSNQSKLFLQLDPRIATIKTIEELETFE